MSTAKKESKTIELGDKLRNAAKGGRLEEDVEMTDDTFVAPDSEESMAAITSVAQHYPSVWEAKKNVNKDKFIAEAVEDPRYFQIYLAPPGFGKSYFVSRIADYYRSQEKPTIYFSLKHIKADNFKKAEQQFHQQMIALYLFIERTYPPKHNKKFPNIQSRTETERELSLANLCKLMHQQLKSPITVLIDDYDVPLYTSYKYGYSQSMKSFLDDFFNKVVKGSPWIAKIIFTGVFPFVSADSQMDNYVLYTTSDHAGCFGFTKDEVAGLLTTAFGEQPGLLDQVTHWYGGYQFGKNTVYNPGYILRFIEDNRREGAKGKFTFNRYMALDTSVDGLLEKATSSAKEKFKQLIQTGKITQELRPYTSFDELIARPDCLWNFLLASGFLNSKPTTRTRSDLVEITIPNQDVYLYFASLIQKWFPLEKIAIPDSKKNQWTVKPAKLDPNTSFFAGASKAPDPKPASPLITQSMFAGSQPEAAASVSSASQRGFVPD